MEVARIKPVIEKEAIGGLGEGGKKIRKSCGDR